MVFDIIVLPERRRESAGNPPNESPTAGNEDVNGVVIIPIYSAQARDLEKIAR